MMLYDGAAGEYEHSPIVAAKGLSA